MRLLDRVAAPSIERIVEKEAGVELLEIVAEHARQAERGREKARRLRRQIEAGGVGSPHDERQPLQCLGLEAELLDHRIEGAAVATMAPEHAFDVERRRREPFGDRHDLAGATNRKAAFGSTNLRISQGQAMRSTFGLARVTQTVRPRSSRFGRFFGVDKEPAGISPGLEAAFERLGRHAFMPEPGCRALAELQAFLADDDDGLADEVGCPEGHGGMISRRRARQGARVGLDVLR